MHSTPRRWRRPLITLFFLVPLAAPRPAAAGEHVDLIRRFMLEQRHESRAHAGAVLRSYESVRPSLLLPDREALRDEIAGGRLVPLPRGAEAFNVRLRVSGSNPIAQLDPDNQPLYVTARPEVIGMLLDIGSRLKLGQLDVTSLVRHGEYQQRLARRNPNARTRLPTHAMGLAVDVSVLHMPVTHAQEVRRVLVSMAARGDLHYVAERQQLVFHVVPAAARREWYREMAASLAAASSLQALRPWSESSAERPPAPSWELVPQTVPPLEWSHGPVVALLEVAERATSRAPALTAGTGTTGVGAVTILVSWWLRRCLPRRREAQGRASVTRHPAAAGHGVVDADLDDVAKPTTADESCRVQPLDERMSGTEYRPPARQGDLMAGPHVLLVSQDADANALYSEWFARTAQLRTSCAATLADARPLSASADVVLLDVTRDEHWKQCASLWAGHDMPPVVVLTGWVAADGRFRRRAFASGCAAFIAKPCHPRVVVAVLRRVLNGERQIAIA